MSESRVCWNCGGLGKVDHYEDYPKGYELKRCKPCKGFGRVSYESEEDGLLIVTKEG